MAIDEMLSLASDGEEEVREAFRRLWAALAIDDLVGAKAAAVRLRVALDYFGMAPEHEQ